MTGKVVVWALADVRSVITKTGMTEERYILDYFPRMWASCIDPNSSDKTGSNKVRREFLIGMEAYLLLTYEKERL